MRKPSYVKSSDITCQPYGVVMPALCCYDLPFYREQISTSNATYPTTSIIPTPTPNNQSQKSHIPSMSKDLPPTLPDADASSGTHPLPMPPTKQKEDRARKRCDRAGMIVRFSLTPKLDRDMTFRRMRERGRQKPEQKKPWG